MARNYKGKQLSSSDRKKVDAVNKRIMRLEEALRKGKIVRLPSAIETLLGEIGSNRIKIPRGKKLTEQWAKNTMRMVDKILSLESTTITGAIKSEKIHRENIKTMFERKGRKISDSELKYVFDAIGDVDFKYLQSRGYSSDEILEAIDELIGVKITPSTDYVLMVLEDSLLSVIEDVLEQEGIPKDIDSFDYLVDYAYNNSVEEAIKEYSKGGFT